MVPLSFSSLGAKSKVKLNDLSVTPLKSNSKFGLTTCPLVLAKTPSNDVLAPKTPNAFDAKND